MNAGYIDFVFIPNDNEIKLCLDFATNSSKYANYEKRNQKKLESIIFQTKMGKLGELAVKKWVLSKKYKLISDIDFNVYSGNERGWQPDCVFENISGKNIRASIKTSIFKRCGNTEYLDNIKIPCKLPIQHSYTFQFRDNDGNGGTDRVNADCCIFCNVEYNKIIVKSWVNYGVINQMFINPFFDSLKGIKRVIMADTCGKDEHGNPFREYPCGISELIERNKK